MTLIVFQNYMNKINHEIALLVKKLNLSTYKHKDQNRCRYFCASL